MRDKRILTVDDERDVLFLCRVNLEPAGFVVSEAINGEEALRILTEHPDAFDVILLDVMMPVMNGWELLERIKAHPVLRDIPVVMFSAWVRGADRARSLGGGAVVFVEKPFSPRELITTIENVLAVAP